MKIKENNKAKKQHTLCLLLKKHAMATEHYQHWTLKGVSRECPNARKNYMFHGIENKKITSITHKITGNME